MTPGLFMECIRLWWDMFFYSEWFYFALFLPIVMILYQAAGKKYCRFVLLGAGWFLFLTLDGKLFFCNILAVVFCREIGIRLERIGQNASLKGKEKNRAKRKLLVTGVLLLIAMLFAFKYLNFFGENIGYLAAAWKLPFVWKSLPLVVPMGISYYTLEAIAYLTDVSGGKIPAEKSYVNLALFLSFFPKIIEGPILRYGDVSEALSGGGDITYVNLTAGYQRILWGLFKKLLIADHLAPAVSELFGGGYEDGSAALAAAVLFTLQEYADFSGTIDIAIGSGRIFGIRMAENFRQPFFAKSASEFWRRWHITLGSFFRDYVFYPLAISKPVMKLSKRVKNHFGKKAASFVPTAIALFGVWSLNGLWHGPKWTYIFFGMYYFVMILAENLLEEPVKKLYTALSVKEESIGIRIFRSVKLFIIVMVGELFFRADSVKEGARMLKSIVTDFHVRFLYENAGKLGMDVFDYITVAVALLVVLIVGIFREKDIPAEKWLRKKPVWFRYAFWYAAILSVVIFGAYGSGYSVVDMIYAKF